MRRILLTTGVAASIAIAATTFPSIASAQCFWSGWGPVCGAPFALYNQPYWGGPGFLDTPRISGHSPDRLRGAMAAREPISEPINRS